MIPVRRGHETYDQRLDPDFRRFNDDIHPVDGPAGVRAAIPRLLLDPGRPLHIRHSTTVRTRKGAEIFADLLRRSYDVHVTEDAALAELDYDATRLWTREEHNHPEFTRARRLERFFRPMLTDDDPAYPGGHQVIARAVAALRRVLATAGPVNHLWVSHGLVMPFIYMSIVDGIPPSAWTMERARTIGAADYATGFHVRLPLCADAPPMARAPAFGADGKALAPAPNIDVRYSARWQAVWPGAVSPGNRLTVAPDHGGVAMQWNQFRTDAIPGMTAEMININGNNGDTINAYYAQPTGSGPFPGVVLVHHLPGWDELYLEFTRRFAQHGHLAISPNLYARAGHGSPDDIAAKVRGAGGVPDAQVVGDCLGALAFLKSQPNFNGKAGIIGTCSGGRHAYLVACTTRAFDAVVDLWGGRVVQDELTENQPVSPVTLTKDLNCPVLGIFGNDDQAPSPAQVDQHEEELKKHGKQYEFYRYDGAGHGFWYYDRPAYRPEQAMDAWGKVFTFFEKNLS